ncbi:cellulose synthase/poly-beta-1,6-N-acetylglucosamine synthase-like glycosyltransferase [Paenarthrobacter nitroguajacolicus]|uniref:glycosyltransferase n=1 Tax=Paenarthrobacter nitroguajacolicus TaxID=211146 RepID=UPI002859FDE4|nr:glycosyltransferase family 2 protein [Paenarthrobacter nitroguajacolicus]MDR6986414.1 cellulose synthase/poly-beta-1,6-N-acetylglucosamine synthase-like glycosyltransferase [Paenarthrobacter nitroguajacolicus]
MTFLNAASLFVQAGGLVILCFGMVKVAYVPLALYFNWFQRSKPPKHRYSVLSERPLVSVIVPGYNEAVVITKCVESILASRYLRLEVILVDDGSTDSTAQIMAGLADQYDRVRFLSQSNAGKGAALNFGIAAAQGDILMFVDADGIFAPDTLMNMLEGFDHPKVGAVCGDDRPVNLNRVQTMMLAVLSHVGTGLVRRALSLLHCLPIVSGNIGAFRSDLVRQLGGFHEDTLGEDLELTWRVYKAGYRVRFQPKALVYAESPSTMGGLWRQRVRWSRGLLQTLRLHRGMLGRPRYGMFGPFLVFNAITMVAIPMLQLFILAVLPYLYLAGEGPVPGEVFAILGWLGLFVSLALACFSIGLNRSWKDLRFVWTLPLWPLYSVFVGLALASAIVKEIKGSPAKWNKLQRTGVISVTATESTFRNEVST